MTRPPSAAQSRTIHSGHDLAVTVSAVYRHSWSAVPEHRPAENRRRAACYHSTTTPVVARPANPSAARATITEARRDFDVSVEMDHKHHISSAARGVGGHSDTGTVKVGRNRGVGHPNVDQDAMTRCELRDSTLEPIGNDSGGRPSRRQPLLELGASIAPTLSDLERRQDPAPAQIEHGGVTKL